MSGWRWLTILAPASGSSAQFEHPSSTQVYPHSPATLTGKHTTQQPLWQIWMVLQPGGRCAEAAPPRVVAKVSAARIENSIFLLIIVHSFQLLLHFSAGL